MSDRKRVQRIHVEFMDRVKQIGDPQLRKDLTNLFKDVCVIALKED